MVADTGLFPSVFRRFECLLNVWRICNVWSYGQKDVCLPRSLIHPGSFNANVSVFALHRPAKLRSKGVNMPIRSSMVPVGMAIAGLVSAYLGMAYLLLPQTWHFLDQDIDVSPASMVTRTESNIPGDPINVGLIGTSEGVFRAFAAAGWDTADDVTLKTAVKIGVSVLFDRPYPDAPVSPLMYDGRKQDLAFEKPVGGSADQRHHVRLWNTGWTASDRPLWLGSASFDRGVGFSHDTGQITHHISADIDAERDRLMRDLQGTGQIASTSTLPGIGPTDDGRNGGGDRYVTDGNVLVGTLVPQRD